MTARQIWESHQLRDYSFNLRIAQHHSYTGSYLVQVVDGRIANISAAENVFDPNSTYRPVSDLTAYDPTIMKVLPARIVDYTMDNLFNVIELRLKSVTDIHVTRCDVGEVEIKYDSELGFISYFASEYAPYDPSLDLLCPSLREGSETFIVENLQPLDK
jgi:hypothetical protein